MLVLAGANDGCIPPALFADARSGLAAGSRVEILPGAGHFMHLERPDEVARLALEWFARLIGVSALTRSGFLPSTPR